MVPKKTKVGQPPIKAPVELSLALILALSSGVGQIAPQILDLTKQSRAKIQSMGVPGASVGGIGGEPQKRGYELPLRLGLKQFRVEGNSLTLNLELANTGKFPISIPACVDSHEAFPSGAVGRRVLNLGLVFEGPKRSIDQIVDVTFGSASKAQCLVVVNPASSLLVTDEIQIPNGKPDKDIVSVKAFLNEWRIEDSRYFIQDQSQRIESESIKIPGRVALDKSEGDVKEKLW
jgi:hypothetical protein